MFANINYLTEKFLRTKDNNWKIFAGSAVSFNYSSGLPSVDILKYISLECLSKINSKKISNKERNKIFEYRNNLENGLYKQYFKDIPFETYMSFLYRNIPSFSEDFISDIYGEKVTKSFNTNHQIISLLLKYKYVNQIITTNYDLLFEEAFLSLKLKPKTLVIQAGKKPQLFNNSSGLCNFSNYPIIKLHGCCSIKKSVIFTEEGIDRIREQVFKILSTILKDSYIIFVGYGGKDHLDIMPIIRELSNNKKIEFFWLYRTKEDIPQNLNATFIKHDLEIEKGNNRNALISLAEKADLDNSIINELGLMPKKRVLKSKLYPIINESINNSPDSDITSLKTLASIFEHIKIGKTSLELVEISKKIDRNSFSYSDCGRFYEILRLYPLAINSFKKSLKEEPESVNKKISNYCSLAFCQASMFLLNASNRNYKLAEQLSLSLKNKINIFAADELIRGQIELLLKSIEARFLTKKQKDLRIARISKLLNESEELYKFNATLLALYKRNKARLLILQAKTRKDLLEAEREALEAFKIAEARNQIEAKTVIIRTLAITNPKKYLNQIEKLIDETRTRQYRQEHFKLKISYLLNNKFSNNQKWLKYARKFFNILLSFLMLFKPFYTLTIWYFKKVISVKKTTLL